MMISVGAGLCWLPTKLDRPNRVIWKPGRTGCSPGRPGLRKINNGDSKKVAAIETIRLGSFPNILWVQIHTDEGTVGLGETFYGAEAVEGHIHQTIAPCLIGKDPRNIERHQAHLIGYRGFGGSGAEVRGRSAVDIALWDILAKSVQLPLRNLLGGKVRDSVRAYNTCAGYSYVQTRPTQGTANFGLDAKKGQYIGADDLRKVLEPFEKIRKAVGDRIDIMAELHS